MNKDSMILIAGANGMVGRALHRTLTAQGYTNVISAVRETVDFTDQQATLKYFDLVRPDYVFIAAAKVGGIMSNLKHKAEFIYENLMIQSNIIHSSYLVGVKKLMFLGSSCIYPKNCPQPIKEEYLLSSELEPTNDAYAIAKIAGVKMCQSYREQYGFNAVSVMPTNLYGPYDNFDPETSHVLPGFIAKFSKGDNVVLWGDGTPKREFMHVDDMADACIFVMNNYDSGELLNIGVGEDISIKDLATAVAQVTGYKGEVTWDSSKPNGTPRKLLNVDKLTNLGWNPSITLEEGLVSTYQWYKDN